MDNRPIGVFDSGLGGLSVWRELRKGLPHESLYYFGDGLNCPYGSKSGDEVCGYVDRAVEVLVEKGIKMLVVACNAATAFAIDRLRGRYDFPIIGMEPAVKPAALSSRTGVIGVLATEATLGAALFRNTMARYADMVRILTAVGEGFVELVERNMEDTPEAVDTVRRVLDPMLDEGADRIVLGCTHYPFLAGAMKTVAGERAVEFVDPAPAIVRRVGQLLAQNDMAASENSLPDYGFFTAGDHDYQWMMRSKALAESRRPLL